MKGFTKFASLAVASVALVVVMVLALAVLGTDDREATAGATPSLFDQELVQDIYRRVSPAVFLVRADLKSGDTFTLGSIGSGFLIDEAGHIVTNEHVIRGADRVLVEIQEGILAEVEVLGASPGNDLALLRVNPALLADINPVELGRSSQIRPGQLAMAIGSPYGLGGSISVGVISGIDRVLGSEFARPVHGILQTDAVINPGDSGGPLLDREGRVVGINTAVQVTVVGPTVESDGQNADRRLGFALPVDTLIRLLPALKDARVIQPTFLGIAATPVSSLLAERLQLTTRSGLYVTKVMQDSPAGLAGLAPAQNSQRGLPLGGDVITGVNGVPVATVAEFFAEVDGHSPGDTITLNLKREQAEVDVRVTLDRWPAEGNPFVDGMEVGSSVRGKAYGDGTEVASSVQGGAYGSYYPLVPSLPGFPFPNLYPERP